MGKNKSSLKRKLNCAALVLILFLSCPDVCFASYQNEFMDRPVLCAEREGFWDGLITKTVEICLEKSDAYLAEGQYEKALEAINDGIKRTRDSRLEERAEYLRENIVVVQKTWQRFPEGEKETTYYDESGNEIKHIWYKEDGDISWWREYEYREDGKEARLTNYDADGNVYWWKEHEYDADGNETSCIAYNADGSVDWQREAEYDEEGNVVKFKGYTEIDGNFEWCWAECFKTADGTEVLTYSKNGILSCRYEFDKNGNEIKKTYYKIDGGILWWEDYTYDENGNRTEEVHYGSGGLDFHIYYEYDENGNEIRYTHYDAEGRVKSWVKWAYDENGNETEYALWDIYHGLTQWIKRKYDEEGNEIKSIYYDEHGEVRSWHEYEYENGNQTKDTYYGPDGGSLCWGHEYDAFGNMVKGWSASSESTWEYEYEFIG